MVLVRSSAIDREARAALAEAVVASLGARGVIARRPPPREPEPEPDHRAAIALARRAYEELRLEEAVQGVEAVVAAGDASGGLGLDREGWIEAHLLLALCRAASGDDVASEAAVRRALAIEPELVLAPERWAPPFRDRVDRVRADLGALATLSLRIEPAGTQVSLDGRAVALDALLELPPGVHRVRAAAPGYHAEALTVELEPGQSAERFLVLAIDPAAWLDDPGPPGSPVDANLRAAAAALDASLLVIDVSREGGRLIAVARGVEREVRASALGVAELAEGLAAALTAGPSEPEEPEPPREPATPWIALGVGAGVLALGLAIGLGVGLGTQNPSGFALRGEWP